MDIRELGAIGELVGGVAVIASLIYVGFQVRQNTKMEGVAAHRAMLAEAIRYHQAVTQIPEIVQTGLSGFADLSHRDQLVFAGFMQPFLTFYESVIDLYRKGVLDGTAHLSYRNFTLALILTPGGAQWWEASKDIFDPRIREALDGAIATGRDLPPPLTSIAPFYGAESGASS